MKNKMKNRIREVLDKVLDRVLEEVLEEVLEVRLMAMLGEETPTPKVGRRAKAGGKASREAAPEAPEALEAEAPKAPEAPEAKVRRRAVVQTMNLEEALRVAEATLEKYRGVRTKGGKDYADVLMRRIKAVVRHAEKVGADPYRAVWDSLKLIQTDPVRYVESGYTLLAETLGLPPAPKG